MEIIRSVESLNTYFKENKKTVGFVPTMGSIHDGHLSLVDLAKKRFDLTCVSIFVNPTQFGPNEDFANYPRSENEDLRFLGDANVDIVYLPQELDVYPYGTQHKTEISLEHLSKFLCGKSRPLHFEGVLGVVLRLINQVRPNGIFLGKKDYQQCKLLEFMIKDLQIPTAVYFGEIVRDSNGLAISSRNKYLDQRELVVASQLFKSLSEIKEFFIGTACYDEKELINFLSEQYKKIESKGFKVEYLEIRDSLSLDSCNSLKSNQEYILLVAAKLNNVRLIDNIEFTL